MHLFVMFDKTLCIYLYVCMHLFICLSFLFVCVYLYAFICMFVCFFYLFLQRVTSPHQGVHPLLWPIWFQTSHRLYLILFTSCLENDLISRSLQILVDDRLKKSGVVYESIGFYYLRQDSLVVYQRQRCKTMRITNLYLTPAG